MRLPVVSIEPLKVRLRTFEGSPYRTNRVPFGTFFSESVRKQVQGPYPCANHTCTFRGPSLKVYKPKI